MTTPTLPPDPPRYVTTTGPGTPHGSLWDIAEDVFEDGTRWHDIYAANRDVIGDDPNRLRVGMRLVLPPLEIRPAYIRSVAKSLDDEGVDILAKLGQARNKLDAIGNFWGGDDLGTKFYKGADGRAGYEASADHALDGVAAFADFYRNVAGRLRDMADRHDQIEWENTIQALDVALKEAES
ncbi:hypothetical protein [Actinoallomurus sp. NPDC050550]|uniref:LysM peptidoglycan-binding domain-containing protein n=1 Tax=Actinoallomurus sp. NPDC050550 TaxID=3154937 RepID=UPI0033D63AE0